MRYACGAYYNLLGRGTVTASPGSDSVHVLANLYDQDEPLRWMVSALGADPYVNVDIDLLLGVGNMETNNAGEPSGWTEGSTGTGNMARTTTAGQFNGGTAGMSLAAGNAIAMGYRDVTVPAGERLTIRAYLKGDGTNAAKIRVYIKETAQYVQTDGSLGSSAANALSRSTASFAQSTLAFRAPTVSALQATSCTLRIQCYNDVAASTVFVDDVELIPTVNGVSILGHNIDALNTVVLQRSDDNSSFATEATLTMKQPAFYGYLSTAKTYRYWRLKTTGTNTSKLWVQKLFLGYFETMTRSQRYGWTLRWLGDQSRSEAPGGQQWIHARGVWKRRGLALPFGQASDAEFDEIREEIMVKTEHGRYPMVIIPKHSAHYVMHGHVDESIDARMGYNLFETEVPFVEDPFVVVSA